MGVIAAVVSAKVLFCCDICCYQSFIDSLIHAIFLFPIEHIKGSSPSSATGMENMEMFASNQADSSATRKACRIFPLSLNDSISKVIILVVEAMVRT